MSSQKEILGKNLEKLLDERKIDQKVLADYLNVSEMSVSNWVNGNKYPRINNVQRMADYFGVKKSDLIEDKANNVYTISPKQYTYYPTAISAGLPLEVDGITEASKISISDEVLGKYANDRDIFFVRANGESMNNLFEDGSLLAIKPVTLDNLKNGDIVVYSVDGEYSVKHYYKYGDTIAFKPNSTIEHEEHTYNAKEDNIQIHGVVVTYVINRD